MKLAILIYGNQEDENKIKTHLDRLQKQLNYFKDDEAEVLYFYDNDEASIEEKKEWLLQRTQAKYHTFLDAETVINDYYVLKRLNAIKQGETTKKLIELGIYNKQN